jgi:3-deoxy-D-manno-octulosonic-acid transferase
MLPARLIWLKCSATEVPFPGKPSRRKRVCIDAGTDIHYHDLVLNTILLGLIYPILLAPVAAYLYIRRRSLGPDWRQRFGYYPPPPRPGGETAGGPLVWLHAAGLGEMKLALRVADALHGDRPGLSLTLTTATPDALALARRRLAPGDELLYLPLDFTGPVRRAFRRIRPDFIVLTEMEFWPNLMRQARANDVPVMVMNARMPAGEARRYRLAGFLFRELLAGLRLVCARETEDAHRFIALGVPAENVQVTGNLKFDAYPAAAGGVDHGPPPGHTRAALGLAHGRPVVMAGSTHSGEEKIFLKLAEFLRGEFPGLVLVLAPRDIGRVDALMEAARRQGQLLTRSSRIRAGGAQTAADHAGIIVDTLGELGTWYGAADVVFVGKSLTGRGGQDIIEAAAAGTAVVCGPHMEHFLEIVRRFLDAGAVMQVEDAPALAVAVGALLRDPARRQVMASKARGVILENRGATGRTVAWLGRSMAARAPEGRVPASDQ